MILSNFITINFSKMLSSSIAAIVSFLLNKKWTFKYQDSTSAFLFFKYAISQILNIACNVLINSIVYSYTENKVISFIIATGVALIFNYSMQRFIVFYKIGGD